MAEWTAGEPVKGLVHFNKPQVRMYLASPENRAEALFSSVINDGIKDASPLMSQAAMLAYTAPKNCELVNKPGWGFSEYAGCLKSFHVNIDEGVRQRIPATFPED